MNIERDAMDDLDDAINALVRRGTDTWQREHALAEILLAGSPWAPVERTRDRAQEARDGAYYVRLFMARGIAVRPDELPAMVEGFQSSRAARDLRDLHGTHWPFPIVMEALR